ncbi:MAG: ketoacid-CoA transferase, partial [Desulfobacteraceae bacterium]|nr:ketoacid-CoA transferase [Desulfobacteraceae bacterium]
KREGLADNGPTCVVTDMGIMGFDETTKEMYLTDFYPGIDPLEIKKNVGFDIDVSKAKEIQPPLSVELEALRKKIDPENLIL